MQRGMDLGASPKTTTTEERVIKAIMVGNNVRQSWTGTFHLMIDDELTAMIKGGKHEVSICGLFRAREKLFAYLGPSPTPWLKIKRNKCKLCAKRFNKVRKGK